MHVILNKSDRLCKLDMPMPLSNDKQGDVLLRDSSYIVHFVQTLLRKHYKHIVMRVYEHAQIRKNLKKIYYGEGNA